MIDTMMDGIKDLLNYRKEELVAGLENGHGKLSFSIGVKMEPGADPGDTQVTTRLTLIPERIRDENIRVFNKNQLPLPGMEERRYALK
jgi:hypothetical protein